MDYTLIRSRRKTLSLQVGRDGCVVARAPLHMPRRDIDAFVEKKADWLAAAIRAAQARQDAALRLENGAVMPWLGQNLTLKLTEGSRPRLDGRTLLLPAAGTERALENWCRGQARAYLAGRCETLAGRMGVRPAGLSITGARSRWGSCSAQNRLNFSFRLLFCPPELVDYVVVHELAHIRQKNHAPAFWSEVATLVPDWRERRKALGGWRHVMDFL